MSRISQDKTSWRAAGLAKKYGITAQSIASKTRLSSRKKWCKGKKGTPHDFVVITTRTVSIFTYPETWTEKRCKRCGRKEIEIVPDHS